MSRTKTILTAAVILSMVGNGRAQTELTLLKGGQAAINNNSSSIVVNTDNNMLGQKRMFNSYGIMGFGGLRSSNGFGVEIGVGYLNQRWNYEDGTSSYFTNGRDYFKFSNKMAMMSLDLSLHKTFSVDNTPFMYAKCGLGIMFISPGSQFNDVAGVGSYTINSTYSNSMTMSVVPEIGFIVKSDQKREIAVFASYRAGFSPLFNLDYNVSGGGQSEMYQVSSNGNAIALGLKYTMKSPLSFDKKEKLPKEPKVKEPKEPKEPKEKEPKEKKEKELKVDKDGVPKTLKDRDVVKNKTIYVESTNITFRVWDSGKEIDGDTISLNLNGEWVLENFGLAQSKHEVSVSINPDGKNFLMLFAINMGKFPPNTAAVSVWDGVTEQKLVLKSDLKSCGALNIVYKPKN